MASTVPALRGEFGSFEYWLTTMHVGELVSKVTIPRDMKDWQSLTLEERYQRDINLTRVKKEIAPYFANDADRFSSALILAVMNNDGMAFEPLESVGGLSRLPNLYKTAASNIGFLTLTGQEVFVPLDGQHTAKALKYAVSGSDDNNAPIDGVSANVALATEDVAVLLVRFDEKKSRRIFNKVNRYAKPTPKGQNLITDDDDPIAMITRRVVSEDGAPDPRLVRFQSNTLSVKAPEFTTLSTLYDSNVAIVQSRFSMPAKPGEAPADQVDLWHEQVLHVWEVLLQNIEAFQRATEDEGEDGDKIRQEIRKENLLGKPVAQQALVKAFLRITEACPEVPEKEVCERLNLIDWRIDQPHWHGVIMNPNGRIMSGKTAVNRTAEYISHLAGVKLTDEEKRVLIEQIAGEEEYTLPAPLVK